jgi:hypothetical protein
MGRYGASGDGKMNGVRKIELDPARLLGWQVRPETGDPARMACVKVSTTKIGETTKTGPVRD